MREHHVLAGVDGVGICDDYGGGGGGRPHFVVVRVNYQIQVLGDC